MPFTLLHMGPGLLIRSLLRGSFSLMVFGWAQIIMDIQPLFVMLTGEGHLHGFSHTFVGAALLGVVAAISGKWLSEIGLKLMRISENGTLRIGWPVAFFSAFLGTASHVVLDALMHADVEPFYPLMLRNDFLGIVTIENLHALCFYSGIVGSVIYFSVRQVEGAKVAGRM